MSIYLVQRYQAEVEKLIRFGGSTNEGALEQAFANLLGEYCKPKGFVLVPKIAVKTPLGKTVIPDGVIKDSLRLDWGYWESKDEKDDLDEEIAAKFKKDYPKDNILFEDHTTAVLYRGGKEMMRVPMSDAAALDGLLTEFISYEPPMVRNFRTAIDKFKADLPVVVESLREMIDEQAKVNKNFREAQEAFWELCKQVINPEITRDDIREMLIQHILTEEIFNTIFDETQFHRENNIAKELTKVEETFFTGQTKRDSLSRVKHYYEVINATAAGIADHHEKQKFLKVIYETFYKAYNPKAADRLGIVYTPGEIVNFMIESTDYLLHKHFGKGLGEKNVEILDPATGTGTFICDIIDYLSAAQLEYKYKNEIHANEVAILPYYIANLNIEFTYKQKTGKYAEFENICFVDTLDNVGFDFKGKQEGMFGLAAENAERIKRQNKNKISVIIGNPPYNANQMNENENNKNREYEFIDKRIKATYIKESTAQKTKVYDMYARFFRWASDRLNEDGVIAFISNNSFINARTFDGFRKSIQTEFDFAYVIDLGGNIRELSGKDGIFLNEEHTIFGVAAAVGIAVTFLVKKKVKVKLPCEIRYIQPCDIRAKRTEKLDYLAATPLKNIEFNLISPDKNNNWINLSDNDFESLIPVADKKTKLAKRKEGERALFKLYTLGVVSARDEWVTDLSEKSLTKKINYLINSYSNQLKKKELVIPSVSDARYEIKWTRRLKKLWAKKIKLEFCPNNVIHSIYRPFNNLFTYFSKELNEEIYQLDSIFDAKKKNKVICFSGVPHSKPQQVFCVEAVFHHDFLEKTQCLPLYRYDDSGNRIDNITDWGLAQFRDHYKNKKITKEDIFQYVYGVLHDPKYRKKYELNLKREFPRIPFYTDFKKWAKWGEELMELHIGYETVKAAKLSVKSVKSKTPPKAKLKVDKEHGLIILDEDTTIGGIPKEAWEYKLGNRSALEWILDQYKEKTPKDPTIREKFNTYKFSDYKDKVIDLLKRVTTVSARTVEIMGEMEGV
ncbi:MAG: type ISP restriction/modification enzyme [bacterium]